MDIDLVQSQGNKLQALDGAVNDIRGIMQVFAMDRNRQATEKSPVSKQRKHDYKWTSDNKPICGYCQKIGHKWRQCHLRTRNEPNNPNTQIP